MKHGFFALRVHLYFIFCLLDLGLTSPVQAEVINLLTNPDAAPALESALSSGADTAEESKIRDGDEMTVGSIRSQNGSIAEIVYGFSKTDVAINQVSIKLGAGVNEEVAKATLEVLVSNVSASSGYTSLRIEPLKKDTEWQSFSFTESGAKWIMLRFTMGKDFAEIPVAELKLNGHLGPPRSVYAFKESPATALAVLAKMKDAVTIETSEDERSLFQDASDGKFDQWSFAEAALLASGLTTKSERDPLLKRIDQLFPEASLAVAAGKSPFEKGDLLLRWLHTATLKKGYSAHQTDLSILLQSTQFNCVSSAIAYNIFARKLGLDARAIEVPDHAFSVLYDGVNHADVETTTKEGFNPARNLQVLDEFARTTGFRYIPDSNRNERREIGEVGLVAITYYNHGVLQAKEKQYGAALLSYFKALSLDPQFSSAVQNALATLANWSVELARERSFDKATAVLNSGLELAPNDLTLKHNFKYVWQTRVQALADAGDTPQALALLREVFERTQDKDFVELQATIFLSQGEALIKDSKWKQAEEITRAALSQVDPAARDDIEKWQAGLRIRWADSFMDQKNYSEAVKILGDALVASKSDYRIENNLGYATQEWAKEAAKTGGDPAAQKVLEEMVQRFPAVPSVQRASTAYVLSMVSRLSDAGEYGKALESTQSMKHLLKGDSQISNAIGVIYDKQAQKFLKEKNYEQAIAVYAEAQKAFPNDSHIENNASATWSMWAKEYVTAKDWKTALEIYEKAHKQDPSEHSHKQSITYVLYQWGLQELGTTGIDNAEKVVLDNASRFPDISDVQELKGGFVAKQVSDLTKAGKFDEAEKLLVEKQSLVSVERTLDGAVVNLYYHWSKQFSDQSNWQSATDIYTRGLATFKESSKLKQNAVATWGGWAQTYMDVREWQKAIDVYEKGLVALPDTGLFIQNIKYCQSKLPSKD